ncbi:MAG TPA: hypothetical protein DCR55_16460 [Lentisphaeria bacterium]|nr:hypothetical protein [Lentisphaeria bacterium]
MNRGQALSFGYTFTAGVLTFTFLGVWIGKKMNWPQEAGVLGGLFMGLFYGAYELWKLIRMAEQNENNDSTDKDE